MESYILEKKDYELIDKLVNVTTSIKSTYEKIYDLEIKGEKDTEEYKKLKGCINLSIQSEENIYKDLNLTYAKSSAIIVFLLKNNYSLDYFNFKEYIVNGNYDNKIIRRIVYTLSNKISSDKSLFKDILPKDIIDNIKDLNIPNTDNIVNHAIFSSIELENALEKDTINGFLTILKEFIESIDYKYFKNDLISSKYNTLFIFKQIEKEFINNNFEITDTLYFNSKLAADYTNTDTTLFEFLKSSFGSKESKDQINKLLDIYDMDYSDKKKAMESILRQCLLRASFMLMNENDISDINYEFHKKIESDNYLNKHMSDHISEQVIINCFNKIEKDKTKPSILSLGFKEN